MTGDTWTIDRADELGVPVEAHCAECGDRWLRPPNDELADTLAGHTYRHRAQCHPATP